MEDEGRAIADHAEASPETPAACGSGEVAPFAVGEGMIERKGHTAPLLPGAVVLKVTEADREWANRRARERQEYMWELAADPTLTQEESEWVGRSPGTPLTTLPAREQEVVVNRHFDRVGGLNYNRKYWDTFEFEDYDRLDFSEGRLASLQIMMGKDAFAAAIAESHTKWKREFAEAEVALRNLPPCLVCGEPRKDFQSVSFLDGRICSSCIEEVWEAALEGPCVRCGAQRSFMERTNRYNGLCSACLNRQLGACIECGRELSHSIVAIDRQDICTECYSRRREQETCTTCGGQRDESMRYYYGDLCWKCAMEQQPSCAACGFRFRPWLDQGDTCWPCRVDRYFRLTEGPST